MRRFAAPPLATRDHAGSSMSPTGRHDAHVHVFDTSNPVAERRTRQVMWLTLVMMVVEIAAGTVLGTLVAPAAHADGQSILWSVRGEHNTVYLFGSIHVLRPGDVGLPPASPTPSHLDPQRS